MLSWLEWLENPSSPALSNPLDRSEVEVHRFHQHPRFGSILEHLLPPNIRMEGNHDPQKACPCSCFETIFRWIQSDCFCAASICVPPSREKQSQSRWHKPRCLLDGDPLTKIHTHVGVCAICSQSTITRIHHCGLRCVQETDATTAEQYARESIRVARTTRHMS